MDNYQSLQILTEPAAEPVLAADVKAQLRLDGTDQDTMIGNLITAARQGVELYLGRALITQAWKVFYDYFPSVMYLPKPPYQSVTHIKYYDADGDLQTLDSSIYQTDLVSLPGRITTDYGQSWPTTRCGKYNAVEVQYVNGYGDAGADVPQPIKQLITSIAVDLYEHPEMNIELRITENKIYRYLAANYKIPVVY